MSDGPELIRAIPVLPCLDIARAIGFYGERLGFAAIFRFDDHAGLMRDGSEIHLRLSKDKKLPKSSGCRIEVRGIESLYQECKKADVIAPKGELSDGGAREFKVQDGDGNTITFVEDPFGGGRA